MQKFYVNPTITTPEICFSPDDNQFYIRGLSSPEDVRTLYYPVTKWIKSFIEETQAGKYENFNKTSPVRLQIDLSYFNSSSAKFLYDILLDMKRLHSSGYPVKVEWFHEAEDSDMQEAGADISALVEMEFDIIPKSSGE